MAEPKSEYLKDISSVLGDDPRPDPKEPVKLDPAPGGDPVPPAEPPKPAPPPAPPAPADDGFEMPPPSAPDELFEDPKPAPALADEGPTDEDLKKWDPKQAETFKNMRLELKDARETIKTQKAGLPSPETDLRLKEAQASLAEAHETIARLNLSEDPRFKAKYDNQKGFLVNAIKEQAKALEINEGIVDILAQLPLRDRLAMINREAPTLKEVALPLFTQLDMLNNQRANELQHASANKEQFSAQRSAEINALQSKVLTDTVKAAADKGHFVFKKIEGNTEWNAAVDNSITTAESIMRSGNIAQQTEAITLGAAAPVYLALYNAERAARKALVAQLSKYVKSGPTIKNPDGSDPAPTKTPTKMTADEAAKRISSKSKSTLQ